MTGLLARAEREIGGAFTALGQELGELHVPGARRDMCLMATLSVVISVLAAVWLRLDNVWWAGISGFMSVQATRPGSLQRGVLRIVGTAVGAGLALLLAPWALYDHAALFVVLLLVTAAGMVGFMLSPHGYAWLFVAITFSLVLLGGLEDPPRVFTFAVYRTLEVVVGTGVAVAVAFVLASEAAPAPPAPPMPGLDELLGPRRQVVEHAARVGLAVALMPLVWRWFELSGQTQMAVTVAAVMAAPVLADHPEDWRSVARRALHRVLGCAVFGGAGLLLLAVPLTTMPLWLAVLAGGVWVATHVQAGPRGVGYLGTQGAVVFIMTLVQGVGPPDSIAPGLERLGGMVGGLALLLLVSLALWPDVAQPQDES